MKNLVAAVVIVDSTFLKRPQ